MAITFESKKYNVVIDSNIIIGVLGNYYEFLKMLEGDYIYTYNGLHNIQYVNFDRIDLIEYRDLLGISDIVSKNINNLSHSEVKLLGYYLMVDSDAKIMVIDEPFLDLDSSDIKKVKGLFNKLIKSGKTIIIGSMDTNIIYSLCKKTLLINDTEIEYIDTINLNNKKLLNKYGLDMPNIVEFIELAKNKNIKIPYSKDIRDLIKDVYRNVS